MMIVELFFAAGAIKALEGRFSGYWFLAWPGTIVHELLHWVTAILLGGRPTAISVVPDGIASNSEVRNLGYVRLSNVTWFNAAPIALAPMLALPVVLAVAHGMTGPTDWVILAVLASVLSQCFPSQADLGIAFHSPFGVLFWTSVVGATVYHYI
jgi:hypothetical protein